VFFDGADSSSDYIASNGRMINEYWIARDLEGSSHFLFQGTIPAFIWRDCGKPQTTLTSINGVPAEIRAGHLSI
jgi:hypothetical protein